MAPAGPLVLLPGMSCSPRLWTGAVDAWHQGVGAVEVVHAPIRGSSVEGCVEKLLDTLPPTFAVAGLSLGGIVAMALVRLAPERVSALALLAVNPRGPTPAQREAWAAQRRALSEGSSARDLQRDLLPVLLSPGSRSATLDEEVLLMADETGSVALADQLAVQASRVDERAALTSVRVPTLVVSGDLDALCGTERHEDVHRRVAGSRLVRLRGVGHLSPMEAPTGVGRALAAWWRG